MLRDSCSSQWRIVAGLVRELLPFCMHSGALDARSDPLEGRRVLSCFFFFFNYAWITGALFCGGVGRFAATAAVASISIVRCFVL